jgi:hypothetical protein
LIPIALASYAYITGKFDTITSPLHLSVLLSILTLIIDIILPYYLFQILTESLLKVPIFIIFIILGSDALRRAKLYLEKLSLILILICGSIAIFMPHPKFISFNMCAIDLIYLAIIELIILFGCAIIVFETEKAHSLIERILSHFAR